MFKGRAREPANRKLGRDENGLINIMVREWKEDSKAHRIIGFWVGGLVIATVWGIYIRQRHKRQNLLNSSKNKEKIVDCTPKHPNLNEMNEEKDIPDVKNLSNSANDPLVTETPKNPPLPLIFCHTLYCCPNNCSHNYFML